MKKRIAAWLLAGMLAASLPAGAQTDATLWIPVSAKIISEEAFYGCTSIVSVDVPQGVEEIGARAFAFSTIKEIYLPQSVEIIAFDAFEGCTDLCIVADEDSYAHFWAEAFGFDVRNPSDPGGEDELPWVPAG